MAARTLMINGKEWASSGINPSRFIGATYSTPCMALARMKEDHRPIVTLHLILVTVWVKMPWHHSDHRVGWTVGKSWGAVICLKNMRPQFYWGE